MKRYILGRKGGKVTPIFAHLHSQGSGSNIKHVGLSGSKITRDDGLRGKEHQKRKFNSQYLHA